MSESDNLKPLLSKLVQGQSLDRDEAESAFETIMSGEAGEAQIGSLLTAMSMRTGGPTVDEIIGAAKAMRAHATGVNVPAGMDVIDTCGTGGDHSGTFNISTTAALIAAGAGAKVAKHGNRSVTSTSGSSQVLEALGVKLQVSGETLTKCLVEAGLCFCFAPAHHPAMKYAVGPRKQLGFRTIFNVLGPLTNPAGAKRQVMGVYDERLTETIAKVLEALGSKAAMVVHGKSGMGGNAGGLDEISAMGPTQISHLREGKVETYRLSPEEVGIDEIDVDAIKADSVEASAAMIRGVLEGEGGPARVISALNAGAALVVAGIEDDLKSGYERACKAIDDGAAKHVLDELVKVSQQG